MHGRTASTGTTTAQVAAPGMPMVARSIAYHDPGWRVSPIVFAYKLCAHDPERNAPRPRGVWGLAQRTYGPIDPASGRL